MNREVFEKKFEKGDPNVIKLVQYTNLYEIMVDMFQHLSLEMIKYQKATGLYNYKGKEVANKFAKAAKDYGKWQRQYIGTGNVAEDFGDRADHIHAIIQDCVLMPGVKRKMVQDFCQQLVDVEVGDNKKLVVKFEE